MLLDLHVHTRRSMDGFSSLKEVFLAARKRGIKFIAITEHDHAYQPNKVLEREFPDVCIIPGCEFTTNKGAHIIGLFVDHALPKGSTREMIFAHVHSLGGLLVMPHPYKPESGYMTIYDDDNSVKNFDFIEIVNGGWRTGHFASQIIDLAKEHNLKMIASSDAHKANQIGLCTTKVADNAINLIECKAILSSITQANISLMIDTDLTLGKGRRVRWFQKLFLYQSALKIIPFYLRQKIKRFGYRISSNRTAFAVNFKTINVDDLPW